ncbi:MAG TPA: outer membrane beta-barrel protein, partial [Gemmatimonadales bacterium]|nr:outer membrane beta-barrel protein [Gemmatimonadales bacterium]
ERPEGAAEAVRTFGQLYARIGAADRTALWLTGDLGGEDGSHWQSLTAILRHPVSGTVAVNLRGEYYADPDQVILATGTANGFEGFGASAGLDYLIAPGVQWRTEGRWLSAGDDVFANSDGGFESGAGFLVTALTFRW